MPGKTQMKTDSNAYNSSWFGYSTLPIDWFGFALTAKEYMKALSQRSLIGDPTVDYEEKTFKAILESATAELNKINPEGNWATEVYVAPFPGMNLAGELNIIFWRKSENNGTVYLVSQESLSDIQSSMYEYIASERTANGFRMHPL